MIQKCASSQETVQHITSQHKFTLSVVLIKQTGFDMLIKELYKAHGQILEAILAFSSCQQSLQC